MTENEAPQNDSTKALDLIAAVQSGEYVVVRRDIVQRAVDEAIDGGRHYEIEAGLRAALEPKP